MKYLAQISISLIIFLYFVIACTDNNNKTSETVSTINLDIDSIKTVKYSELFKIKSVIHFDTTILISKISKIKKADNNLIIKFKSNGYRLLLKNPVSGFMRMIGNKGKGPGEYLTVTDFDIDKKNSLIWLLDGQAGKILKYNYDGNLKDELKHEYLRFAQSFNIINDTIIAVYYNTFLYGLEKYRVLSLNLTKGNIVDRYFEITQTQSVFMTFRENGNFTNTGLFHYKFNRNFYNITSTGIEKQVTINFVNRNLPNNMINAEYVDVRDFVEHLKKTPYAYEISNVYDMQNNFYFNFKYKLDYVGCLYLKNTGKYTLYNKFENDVFGLGESEKALNKYSPCGSDGNTLFFIIEPIDVKSKLEKIRNTYSRKAWKEFYSCNKKWVDIFDSLNIESNPLLVQVQL